MKKVKIQLGKSVVSIGIVFARTGLEFGVAFLTRFVSKLISIYLNDAIHHH